MSKALAHERFKCVKSYAGIEEETPVLLLNGCDFFMVTPSSLWRLLRKKQVTLGSLDHLVRFSYWWSLLSGSVPSVCLRCDC